MNSVDIVTYCFYDRDNALLLLLWCIAAVCFVAIRTRTVFRRMPKMVNCCILLLVESG